MYFLYCVHVCRVLICHQSGLHRYSLSQQKWCISEKLCSTCLHASHTLSWQMLWQIIQLREGEKLDQCLWKKIFVSCLQRCWRRDFRFLYDVCCHPHCSEDHRESHGSMWANADRSLGRQKLKILFVTPKCLWNFLMYLIKTEKTQTNSMSFITSWNEERYTELSDIHLCVYHTAKHKEKVPEWN